MTTPLEVDQIAENGPRGERVHQVQVAVSASSWAQVLFLLAKQTFQARAAKLPIWARWLDAGRDHEGLLDRTEALSRLRLLVGREAPSWALTPEEAQALAQALLEASEPPKECWCGAYIESPSGLTEATGCAAHAARQFGE